LQKIELDFHFVELNNLQPEFHFIEGREMPSMSKAAETLPAWLEVLEEEDVRFLRRFLLGSGSLKALAEEYGVSYPTVRARLDRLIAKVKVAEDEAPIDPFERRLRLLVADDKITSTLARDLLDAHRQSLKRRTDS
jgi:hypothetical protein